MQPARSSPAFALLALTAAAAAQGRIWQVSPGGSIAAVIAQAADGDLLRVPAGGYAAFNLDKALTILGDPGAVVIGNGVPVRIAAIPAGKQVVVAGLAFGMTSFPFLGQRIEVIGNQGRIVFDRVTVSSFYVPAAIEIRSSRQVHLQRCTVSGNPGVLADHSAVTLSDCDLRSTQGSGLTLGAPPLVCLDALVVLSRGSLVAPGGFSPLWAIDARTSTLVIAGDSSTLVQASLGASTQAPTPAIMTQGGSVVLDPAVRVVPAHGGPPVGGSAVVTSRRLASLSVRNGAPGVQKTVDVYSAAGDIVLVFSGTNGDRIPVPGLGDFWLDPFLFLIPVVAVQGPGEHVTAQLGVPNDPGLLFAAWTMQALSGTAVGFQLSNPVAYALH